MGFELEDVQAAARCVRGNVSSETVLQVLFQGSPQADNDLVAAMRASVPPTRTMPSGPSGYDRSLRFDQIATAQLRAAAQRRRQHFQDAGFSAIHVAAALDECQGDTDGALALLRSGWQQQEVMTGAATAAAAPPAATTAADTGTGRNCVLCAANSPGLECLDPETHFFCKGCFEELVTEAGKNDGRVQCPVPHCRGSQWSYATIAQNVSEALIC